MWDVLAGDEDRVRIIKLAQARQQAIDLPVLRIQVQAWTRRLAAATM